MPPDAAPSSPSRARELRAAVIKIVATLIVGAGLFALYSHEVRIESQVRELLAGPQGGTGSRAGGAKAALARDTPAGWLAAEVALEKALVLQPSNPYALGALASVEQILLADGFADRKARAEQALARAEAKDVTQPERFEARALSLIAAGRAGEAETYLLALLSKYGGVPRLMDALGRAQRAVGKLGDAKFTLRKAQDADWRSPRAVADYAFALLEEGAAVEANLAFDRALQANADHLRSYAGKARAMTAMAGAGKTVDLGRARKWTDDALARPAVDLSPALRAQALAARAEVRIAQGDAKGALEDAEAARAAVARSSHALRARALALAASEKSRDKAFDALGAALAADPYDASLYFDGSAALAAAGLGTQAEKLLGKYAALLPKTARYHLALARLLGRKGDTRAATAELQTAAEKEPTNAVVWYELGRIAQQKRDPQVARAHYEKAVQLRDDYPEVYRQMGALYLDGRDVDQAITVYAEALRRYKAARIPEAQLEPFYQEVHDKLVAARERKKAAQWLKEARAVH